MRPSWQISSSPLLPLHLLLLSPDVLKILLTTNPGTPSLLHHNTRELVVLHGSVVKIILVPVPSLVIAENKPFNALLCEPRLKSTLPENIPDLSADVNLRVSIVDEVIHLTVVVLGVALNPPASPSSSAKPSRVSASVIPPLSLSRKVP